MRNEVNSCLYTNVINLKYKSLWIMQGGMCYSQTISNNYVRIYKATNQNQLSLVISQLEHEFNWSLNVIGRWIQFNQLTSWLVATPTSNMLSQSWTKKLNCGEQININFDNETNVKSNIFTRAYDDCCFDCRERDLRNPYIALYLTIFIKCTF